MGIYLKILISIEQIYARYVIGDFIVLHIIFNDTQRINFYIILSCVRLRVRDIFIRYFNNACAIPICVWINDNRVTPYID